MHSRGMANSIRVAQNTAINATATERRRQDRATAAAGSEERTGVGGGGGGGGGVQQQQQFARVGRPASLDRANRLVTRPPPAPPPLPATHYSTTNNVDLQV